MTNILVVLISLGIFIRGVLYFFVSINSKTSKWSKISITKINDSIKYFKYNRFACLAYMFIGGIVSVFILVISLILPDFISKYYCFVILAVFMVDYLIHILVNIKIKITEWDEDNQKKNK